MSPRSATPRGDLRVKEGRTSSAVEEYAAAASPELAPKPAAWLRCAAIAPAFAAHLRVAVHRERRTEENLAAKLMKQGARGVSSCANAFSLPEISYWFTE